MVAGQRHRSVFPLPGCRTPVVAKRTSITYRHSGLAAARKSVSCPVAMLCEVFVRRLGLSLAEPRQIIRRIRELNKTTTGSSQNAFVSASSGGSRAEVDRSRPGQQLRVSRRRVTPLVSGAAHIPSHCRRGTTRPQRANHPWWSGNRKASRPPTRPRHPTTP
jgi:hypothetical protein